jgi:ABC-type phosphate transport system auxiliary subunit
MPRFADIVDEINSLSIEEIDEIKLIIDKIRIEKRREEMAKNHEETKKEYANGKLKFYDNTDDLMNALNEE